MLYELYSPLLHKLEVLKLEKRTDAHLLYLRDALPEYSTIDPDMIAIKHPPGRPVPVNDIVVSVKAFTICCMTNLLCTSNCK